MLLFLFLQALTYHHITALNFAECRSGPSYDWTNLSTDPSTQDAYVAASLQWDGRFAAVGRGTTAAGLTCDHVSTDENGKPTTVGRYTAASKESLHIGMLALIVNRHPLAWHWMAGALAEENKQSSSSNSTDMPTKQAAIAGAIARLTLIAHSYEKFHLLCPGCGGFIPWIGVTDVGFATPSQLTKLKPKLSLPALDNSQLAWSMIAVVEALTNFGTAETATLATRFQTCVTRMQESAAILFLNPNGRVASSAKINNISQPMSANNRVIGPGKLGDPWEGELMLFFMHLLAKNTTAGSLVYPSKIWRPVENSVHSPNGAYSIVAYNGPNGNSAGMLPNGSISVQRGWYFSTHELWKILVLPYLDVPLASRLIKQGERARTWDAKLNKRGGMQGAAYTASPNSVYSNFGIASIATTHNTMADDKQMVTGYGTYPLILVDRGAGLNWHRATASRPLMQSRLGCLEATRSSDAAVALKHSWDTKVTTNLAMLGGLGSLLGQFLTRIGKKNTFENQVVKIYSLVVPVVDGQQLLLGEATPYATAPSAEEVDLLTAPGGLRDFSVDCPRVTPRLPPPLEFAVTEKEKEKEKEKDKDKEKDKEKEDREKETEEQNDKDKEKEKEKKKEEEDKEEEDTEEKDNIPNTQSVFSSELVAVALSVGSVCVLVVLGCCMRVFLVNYYGPSSRRKYRARSTELKKSTELRSLDKDCVCHVENPLNSSSRKVANSLQRV